MSYRKALLIAVISLASGPAWAAAVSTAIKLDTFGYRANDSKVAVFSADPGATVELRNTSDTVVLTLTGTSVTAQGADVANYSGDTLWWVDFSSRTTPGTYRLYSPALAAQSYDFEIRDDIYNAVGKTALKTYYYQRCNTAHPATYAGAAWSDAAACHMPDATRGPASGQTNYGIKDLTGGWHDAGDYNKYVWYAVGDTILHIVNAYEDNPGVFTDSDLNIPESGNGRADVLDEMKYELDWLLKMQLPAAQNYAVLERVRETSYTSGSPPSNNIASTRGYHNPNLESGAMFVGSLAAASRVFAGAGEAAYAATLLNAAKNTWTNWLSTAPDAPAPNTQNFNDKRCWAAAELYRTDPTVTSARTFVEGYTTWSSFTNDPDWWQWVAALAYIQSTGTNATIVTQMRNRYAAGVNSIFGYNDKYRNGMANWQHYWGSNRPRAKYGLYLLNAAKIGATGVYTAARCRDHALDFLHFFHGQNAASMTYLTNMTALGGDHVSWMFYHLWFGASGTGYSVTNFLGKPASVVEPAYPYFAGTDNHGVNDNRTSNYGPAPGFIPGGPNRSYGGSATPPLPQNTNYNKAYRDWAWQQVGTPNTWEITENSISAQGPYVALSAYFMASSITPTPTSTRTITPSFSPTRTATQTFTPSSTRTHSPTASPTRTPTASPTPTPSRTPSSSFTFTPTASPSWTMAPPSATNSETPVLSPTPSPLPSQTFTAVLSPTESFTYSPTFSPTNSPSPSRTPTVSPTPLACPRNVWLYYPHWNQSSYNSWSIPYAKLTHIAHAFIRPLANGDLDIPSDYLEPNLISSAHAAGAKVVVSVGGAGIGTGDGSQYFATMAASPTARANFVAQLEAFVRANGYDGVDLDWEFLTSSTDRTNLNSLVTELRQAFDASASPAGPSWLITAAVSAGSYYGQWWDGNYLKTYIDYFNIMVYDFYGDWAFKSGHNAAMLPSTLPGSAGESASTGSAAVNYWITNRGVPAAQLQYGLAFYGYQYTTENIYDSCGGPCSSGTAINYKDIVPMVGAGWTRSYDANAESPYLRLDSGAGLISYDDAQSIAAKTSYALWTRGLGGVFAWEISGDAAGAPLLEAMWNGAQCATSTPTASITPNGSFTATPTLTPYMSPVATPTFTPALGPNKIEEALAHPNPNPSHLRVRLAGPSDELSLEVFTSALQRVAQLKSGPHPGGWTTLAVPAEFLSLAANGIYYFRVQSMARGIKANEDAIGKMFILK